MKLYVYHVETLEVVAVFNGKTNAECEDAARVYLGVDEYGATYSHEGLTMSSDVREYSISTPTEAV